MIMKIRRDSRFNLFQFFNPETPRGKCKRIWTEIQWANARIDLRCAMAKAAYNLTVHQKEYLRQSQYASDKLGREDNERSRRMVGHAVHITGHFYDIIRQAAGQALPPLNKDQLCFRNNLITAARMACWKFPNGLTPQFVRHYKMLVEHAQSIRHKELVRKHGKQKGGKIVVPLVTSFKRHHGQTLFQAVKFGRGFPKSGIRPEKRRTLLYKSEWINVFRNLRARLQEIANFERHGSREPLPRWKHKWREMARQRHAWLLTLHHSLQSKNNNSPMKHDAVGYSDVDIFQSDEEDIGILSDNSLSSSSSSSSSSERPLQSSLPLQRPSQNQSRKENQLRIPRSLQAWLENTIESTEESPGDLENVLLQLRNDDGLCDTNTNREYDERQISRISGHFDSKDNSALNKFLNRFGKTGFSQVNDHHTEPTLPAHGLCDTQEQDPSETQRAYVHLHLLEKKYDRLGDALLKTIKAEGSADQGVSGMSRNTHAKSPLTIGKPADSSSAYSEKMTRLTTQSVEADFALPSTVPSYVCSPTEQSVSLFTGQNLQAKVIASGIQLEMLERSATNHSQLSPETSHSAMMHRQRSATRMRYSTTKLPQNGLVPADNFESDTNQQLYTDFSYRFYTDTTPQAWTPIQQSNVHGSHKLYNGLVPKFDHADLPQNLQTNSLQNSQTSLKEFYSSKEAHENWNETDKCFQKQDQLQIKGAHTNCNNCGDNSAKERNGENRNFNDSSGSDSNLDKESSQCSLGYVSDDELSDVNDSETVRSAIQHASDYSVESPGPEWSALCQPQHVELFESPKDMRSPTHCKSYQAALQEKIQVLVHHICDNIRTLVSDCLDSRSFQTCEQQAGKFRSQNISVNCKGKQKTAKKVQKQKKNSAKHVLFGDKMPKTNVIQRQNESSDLAGCELTKDKKEQQELPPTGTIVNQHTQKSVTPQTANNSCGASGKQQNENRHNSAELQSVANKYQPGKCYGTASMTTNPLPITPIPKSKPAKSTASKELKQKSKKCLEINHTRSQSTQSQNMKQNTLSGAQSGTSYCRLKSKSTGKINAGIVSLVDSEDNVGTVNSNKVTVSETTMVHRPKSAVHSSATPSTSDSLMDGSSSAHTCFPQKSVSATATNLTDIAKFSSNKSSALVPAGKHRSTSVLTNGRLLLSQHGSQSLQKTFPPKQVIKKCVSDKASSCSVSRLPTSKSCRSTTTNSRPARLWYAKPTKHVDVSKPVRNESLCSEPMLASFAYSKIRSAPKKVSSALYINKNETGQAANYIKTSLRKTHIPCEDTGSIPGDSPLPTFTSRAKSVTHVLKETSGSEYVLQSARIKLTSRSPPWARHVNRNISALKHIKPSSRQPRGKSSDPSSDAQDTCPRMLGNVPVSEVMTLSSQLLLTIVSTSVWEVLKDHLASSHNDTSSLTDLLAAARYVTEDTSLMEFFLDLVTGPLVAQMTCINLLIKKTGQDRISRKPRLKRVQKRHGVQKRQRRKH